MKKFYTIAMLLVFSACTSAVKNENTEVKNGDVTIAYSKEGSGDTALVFVHGWAIDKGYWQKQMDYFKKRYTVVALDLGGHGESGTNRSSWQTDDFANDVIAVIENLHLNKVILIGHSMGGDIVLDAAEKIPSKIIGIVGVDNFKIVSSFSSKQEQEQLDTFMTMLRNNYKQVAVEFSKGSLFPQNYSDTTSVNRVLKSISDMDSVVSIAALQGVFDFGPKEVTGLSQLPLPLHLIVSDYTPTEPDSLRKYCKSGFAVKTIHGTGHYPMIEKPDEFNTLLDEIIVDISKGN